MYTMQSIITHFSLSDNHADKQVTSHFRTKEQHAFCSNVAHPDELNRRSHGTDVASTQSKVFTKLALVMFRWPKCNRILID